MGATTDGNNRNENIITSARNGVDSALMYLCVSGHGEPSTGERLLLERNL